MAFARPTSLGTGFGHFGAGIGGSVFTGPAPTLSAASAAAFSDVFVWGQATTDTASGTLYAVVVASAASTPSAAQIIAGTDAVGAAAPNGNVAVSSTGVKQVLVRGLTAVTAYKVCFAHQTTGGNSNVVSTASFTTDTLVAQFAHNGATTSLAPTGAVLTANAADPFGGTNAVHWVDNNDGLTAQFVTIAVAVTFFNGINKWHHSEKSTSGANFERVTPAASVTATPGNTHWNVTTGALAANAGYTGTTPQIFSIGSGWYMWSSSKDLTGADVAGTWTAYMASVDNSGAVAVRNGTHIRDIYNIRITR
jgi:hypothetical protein